MTRTLAEALESRRLLSAVGPATVFDSAVRTDELYIYQDLVKFKNDANASDNAMKKDAAQIKSSNLSQAPMVKSLVTSFDDALLQARVELQADKLKELPSVLGDERAILAEQKKLAHDKNNATAEASDQTQLEDDRVKVQNDLDAEINGRLEGRESLFTTILQDASTIYGDLQADTQPSAKLSSAENQLNTDAENCDNTLSTDLQQIDTDQTQLDSDLTASQSQQ